MIGIMNKTKMLKKITYLNVLMGISISLMGQKQSPVLMTINDQKITLEEFEAIFRKNNPKDRKITQKDLDDYIDLFINYKLKVRQAFDLKMDTSAAFQNEFAGYKKQLSAPYLKDKELEEKMLREAYERSKTDLHVAHILLRFPSDCQLPEDTLALYNKALQIRNSIKKKRTFEQVAKEFSDDESTKNNGGDLGWFTALMFAYNFECAAYNLPVGKISMPVRTNFGYHIIKVINSRAAVGEVKVAHIYAQAPQNDTMLVRKGKLKIDSAFARLQSGENWAEVVKKYSDDRQSSATGGELPPFGIQRMVKEFEENSFALKSPGDYSKPFQTRYGWHIVKLIERKGIKPFEEIKDDLRKQLQRNPRFKIINEQFAEKIKTNAGYSENIMLFKTLKSLQEEKGIPIEKLDSLDKSWSIFNLSDGYQASWGVFIQENRGRLSRSGYVSYCNLVEKFIKPFIQQEVLEYGEENLDKKYEDFRLLINEYKEGILLFDLMDKKVWSKALNDTLGLKEFFNKNKEKFQWGERIEVWRFTTADESIARQSREEAMVLLNHNSNPDNFVEKYNREKTTLIYQTELFEKEDNQMVDSLGWNPQVGPIFRSRDNYNFFVIRKKVPPRPKDFKEAKGQVISEYQQELEKAWVEELRRQYNWKVNKDVLYTLIGK